jgi:hypothetical protein
VLEGKRGLFSLQSQQAKDYVWFVIAGVALYRSTQEGLSLVVSTYAKTIEAFPEAGSYQRVCGHCLLAFQRAPIPARCEPDFGEKTQLVWQGYLVECLTHLTALGIGRGGGVQVLLPKEVENVLEWQIAQLFQAAPMPGELLGRTTAHRMLWQSTVKASPIGALEGTEDDRLVLRFRLLSPEHFVH